jgi:hypothetical protein
LYKRAEGVRAVCCWQSSDERNGATAEETRIRHSARGAFGIGFSLMICHTPEPIPYYLEPIRYYVEREIETPLTCERCTLDYPIYGVFAFCPDCGSHTSLQILQKNFEVISSIGYSASGARNSAKP